MTKKSLKAVMLFICIMSLTLCSSQPTAAKGKSKTTKKTITKELRLSRGKKHKLKLNNKKYTFSSSDSEIATVNKKHLAAALVCLLAFAALPGYSDAKVSLNKKSISMTVKETRNLKIKGYKGKVSWKSNNKKVAAVNKKGKVTAKKAGQCNIICTAGKISIKCRVNVTSKENQEVVSSSAPTQPSPVQSTSPTASPTAAPTTVPTPTASPEPADIRELSNVNARVVEDGCIGLSGETDATMPTCLNTNISPESIKVTNSGQALSLSDIQVGDVLNVKYYGVVLYSYPEIIQNIISIDIVSRNPGYKNQTYTYKITSIEDDIIHFDYSENSSMNLSDLSDTLKITSNGESVDKSQLAVGDEIRLINAKGIDCDPLLWNSCSAIEIVTKN